MTRYRKRRLITLVEYHKMIESGILGPKDKIELINGQILHMSPIGSKHQAMVDKLTQLFIILFKDEVIVRTQGPISIPELSEPEPDITLLKPKADFYADQHPGPQDIYLVVEVSDTTLEFDRNEKLALYAKAGIPEYWIINLAAQQIECYTQPQGKLYKYCTFATANDQLSTNSFPDKSFNVNQLL